MTDQERVTIMLTREQAEEVAFGAVLFSAMKSDLEKVLANNPRAMDRLGRFMSGLDAIAEQLRERSVGE